MNHMESVAPSRLRSDFGNSRVEAIRIQDLLPRRLPYRQIRHKAKENNPPRETLKMEIQTIVGIAVGKMANRPMAVGKGAVR